MDYKCVCLVSRALDTCHTSPLSPDLEQILTSSQDSPQDVLWLSPGGIRIPAAGCFFSSLSVSSQDRDSLSPSPCSSTDSRAQSLVQIDGVLDRHGTQQWPGGSHVSGRVTGLCSEPQLSLDDIFDKLFPLRAFMLMSLCVLSKDICLPQNIVVPRLPVSCVRTFVVAEARIPLFHSGTSRGVL